MKRCRALCAPKVGHKLQPGRLARDHPFQGARVHAPVWEAQADPLELHVLGVVPPVPELPRSVVPVQLQQARQAVQPGCQLAVLLRLHAARVSDQGLSWQHPRDVLRFAWSAGSCPAQVARAAARRS